MKHQDGISYNISSRFITQLRMYRKKRGTSPFPRAPIPWLEYLFSPWQLPRKCRASGCQQTRKPRNACIHGQRLPLDPRLVIGAQPAWIVVLRRRKAAIVRLRLDQANDAVELS